MLAALHRSRNLSTKPPKMGVYSIHCCFLAWPGAPPEMEHPQLWAVPGPHRLCMKNFLVPGEHGAHCTVGREGEGLPWDAQQNCSAQRPDLCQLQHSRDACHNLLLGIKISHVIICFILTVHPWVQESKIKRRNFKHINKMIHAVT